MKLENYLLHLSMPCKIPLIVVTLLIVSIQFALADLCPKCKDGMYIQSVGECVVCKEFTASGAFKLCKKCSAKLKECEHCRAPLKKNLTEK